MWAVVAALSQRVLAQVFIVMPEHIAKADGQALVIGIDEFVVVAGHPAHAPVVRHVLAGQGIGIQTRPDPIRLTLVIANADPAPGGTYTAPGFMGIGINLSGKGQHGAGDRATVRVNRIAQRTDIAAIADTANNIDDLEAHRCGTDVHRPGAVFPAHRNAGTIRRLAGVTIAWRTGTGAPLRIKRSIACGRERACVHIDHVRTEEHPAVGKRRVDVQHGGMGFKVGVAPRTAGAPVLVLQGDVNILLTIEIARVATYAALQPVIALIIARQAGESVVIHRTGRGDPRGHHRIFVSLKRRLWLTVRRLETGRVAQYQRTLHRRRLRFRLRNEAAKGLLRRVGITQPCLGQRDTTLHIDGRGLALRRGRQRRQRGLGCRLVARGDVRFRQAKYRIGILRLAF